MTDAAEPGAAQTPDAAEPGNVDMTGVVVAVDAQHLATLDDVVGGLRAAGMVVEHTMDALGTVSGRVDPERLESLAGVPGVAAVERSSSIELPPPEADIQ